MMAVAVTTGSTFDAGPPHLFFEGSYRNTGPGARMYDVSSDGEHFVMVTRSDEALIQNNVVLNWSQELEGIIAMT